MNVFSLMQWFKYSVIKYLKLSYKSIFLWFSFLSGANRSISCISFLSWSVLISYHQFFSIKSRFFESLFLWICTIKFILLFFSTFCLFLFVKGRLDNIEIGIYIVVYRQLIDLFVFFFLLSFWFPLLFLDQLFFLYLRLNLFF